MNPNATEDTNRGNTATRGRLGWLAIALGLISFALLASVAIRRLIGTPAGSAPRTSTPTTAARNTGPSPFGPIGRKAIRTRVVLIGSMYCGASTNAAFPGHWAAIRDRYRQTGHIDSANVTIIAVSSDVTIADGVKFFDKLGPFDELNVGGSWTSSALQHYVWLDLVGTAALPQVLVTEQEIDKTSPVAIAFGPERVVARYVGLAQIKAAADSLRLPTKL